MTCMPTIKGPAALQPWKLYMETMASADVLRGGNQLDARNNTALRIRDGKRQIQDGPFADTKDLLGGYVEIDVASLDDALKWAELSPSSALSCTEVWPVMSASPLA